MIKKVLKKFIRSSIFYKLLLYYRLVFNDFKHPDFAQKIPQGKLNSNKVFYVISFPRVEGGLFWIILTNLSHIAYAVAHGYIPIIDLQNYDNQYLENDMHHKENSWEYYFEQPANYTLKDIVGSKHILITNNEIQPMLYRDNYYTGLGLIERNEDIRHLKRLYSKYIRFNEGTQDYIQKEYDRILRGKGKILGVLCRGTDYIMKRPPGHPIQPSPLDVIEKAKQVMLEKECRYLYLATEDEEIYKIFKSVFGEQLLTNEQMRFSREVVLRVRQLYEIQIDRERDKYWRGLEYLSSMYLLSRCNCFIGGLTAGTVGVYMMSADFEYDYVFNLGRYPSAS